MSKKGRTSKKKVHEETLEEIREFLRQRESSYRQVLDHVKGLMDKFHLFTEDGKRTIYRVATRKDYQGEDLKTVESIQDKLKKRRQELKDKGVKDPYTQYTLTDVEDIVGLKVICIYPSDVKIVRDYINKLYHEGNFAKCKEELVVGKVDVRTESGEIEKRESGYEAYHFTVSPPGGLSMFHCEIQVLTLLQEAAAVKSHDLIYKPNGAVKEEYVAQAKLLSDSLRVADEQSMVLEQGILEKRRIERERKNVAKRAIMSEIVQRVQSSQDSELSELIGDINQRENLALANIDDLVNRVICLVGKRKQADLNICRIASYLATQREGSDLDAWALELIDRYIAKAVGVIKGQGHLFKGLILWGLSKDGTIEETKKALWHGERLKDADLICTAKGNISHFIADLEIRDQRDLALEYSEEACNAKPDWHRLDTYGYVRIVFGKDVREVEEGWDKCKQAYGQASDKNVAQPFLHIAQNKALERLTQFAQKELLI